MKTLKNYPACMDVICNIQAMKKAINPSYDGIKDFKNLEKLTYDDLHDMQCTLIHEYNKTFPL